MLLARTILHSILVMQIFSCSKGNNGDDRESIKTSGDYPQRPENPQEPPNEGPECSELYEFIHDGECVVACRTDAEGQKWCIGKDQMPSDLDPTKKVAGCKTGLQNNEKCQPVSVILNNQENRLYIGETPKADLRAPKNEWDRLQEYRIPDGNFLEYAFITKYPASFLRFRSDLNIEFNRMNDGSRIAIYQPLFAEGAMPATIQLWNGQSIKTGPSSVDEFLEKCELIKQHPAGHPRFELNLPNIGGTRYYCGSYWVANITMKCDEEAEQCKILEVAAIWTDSSSN